MGTTSAITQAGQVELERIDDPVHRVAYAFEPREGHLWVHTWFERGGSLPEHFHPTIEEHWEVVEGTAMVRLDGEWRELRPEDGPVRVAPNVRHALKNESGAPVYGRARAVPGGRLEEFLREAARAARQGLYSARNLPTSVRGAIWAAKFAERFRDETVMCSPPPALQRIVLPLVGRLSR